MIPDGRPCGYPEPGACLEGAAEIKNEEWELRLSHPCPQPTPAWTYARRRMMPLSEPSRRWRFVGSKARLVSVPRKFSELSFVVA